MSYARRDHEVMREPRHYSEQEFEALVSSALDELPIDFQRALEHVAIVVSDRGAENHAYGMYVGSRSGRGRSAPGSGFTRIWTRGATRWAILGSNHLPGLLCGDLRRVTGHEML